MSTRTANLLAATARLIDDAVQASLLRELPFGASAPAALISIAHQPDLSIEDLRQILAITHSGTVRLVDRLENDELIVRIRTGQRAVKLRLTPRGRRTLRKLETARLAAVAAIATSLPEAAQCQLEELLSQMLAAQTDSHDDLLRICRLCSFDACQSDHRSCPVDRAAHPDSTVNDAA